MLSKRSQIKIARIAAKGEASRVRAKEVIIEMYLKGHNLMNIRRKVLEKFSYKINNDRLKKLIEKAIEVWENNKNDAIANHKARELEKINTLELEYWLAWERSQQAAKAKNTKQKLLTQETADGLSKEKLGVAEVTKQEREQAGDPRFLDGIQWCVEMRCRLLGLEAPIRTENKNLNVNIGGGGIIRRTNFVVRPRIPINPDSDAATAN